MDPVETAHRWRHRLPHWEVKGKAHFITIRCHGSLPEPVCRKVAEIEKSLAATEPRSEEYARLQRQYFLTVEKYIDRGMGFAPFHDDSACRILMDSFGPLQASGWVLIESVVMPNHVHFICLPETSALPMKEAIKQFKGRSARLVNQRLGRSGRFWQEDWFDRWMRNERELARCIDYLRRNPVKAKLASDWKQYPWRHPR
ncbi:MAG: REP-associated tyrosine transposase [Opitutales bacterium]